MRGAPERVELLRRIIGVLPETFRRGDTGASQPCEDVAFEVELGMAFASGKEMAGVGGIFGDESRAEGLVHFVGALGDAGPYRRDDT